MKALPFLTSCPKHSAASSQDLIESQGTCCIFQEVPAPEVIQICAICFIR